MIKSIVITFQFLVILYLVYPQSKTYERGPSQVVTVPTNYDSLLQELVDLRQYNFSICFNQNLDIRGQNEYCASYNMLDVVLHGKTDDIFKQIEEGL